MRSTIPNRRSFSRLTQITDYCKDHPYIMGGSIILLTGLTAYAYYDYNDDNNSQTVINNALDSPQFMQKSAELFDYCTENRHLTNSDKVPTVVKHIMDTQDIVTSQSDALLKVYKGLGDRWTSCVDYYAFNQISTCFYDLLDLVINEVLYQHGTAAAAAIALRQIIRYRDNQISVYRSHLKPLINLPISYGIPLANTISAKPSTEEMKKLYMTAHPERVYWVDFFGVTVNDINTHISAIKYNVSKDHPDKEVIEFHIVCMERYLNKANYIVNVEYPKMLKEPLLSETEQAALTLVWKVTVDAFLKDINLIKSVPEEQTIFTHMGISLENAFILMKDKLALGKENIEDITKLYLQNNGNNLVQECFKQLTKAKVLATLKKSLLN